MRIAILGGTFDPIHLGHIKPALEVKHQLELDQVWLMPNNIPPHKQRTNVDTQHRLTMVEQVCQQYSQLQLCDIELTCDTPSYTAKTLALLSQRYPQHQFYFIMGMDSFIQLQSWYQYQEIFTQCHIILCQRPGWTLANSSPMHALLNQYGINAKEFLNTLSTQPQCGRVITVDINLQDISSTDIRQRLLQQQDTSHLLAPCTAKYIQQHHLYLD
ncbi:nicotinate-nucleotide adenylyltransferase [Shewanella gaetbuli]|uniref:Probable nicotinate-nucleotide adenylyltransferase n=1 Tax=Shewanella gaetbuli TaxID=220752 RepID=A0A9X1ZM36_9GAMM|nr:nicotinate-nucleotide adenylyltransferase [Shewanella gaetbuli]MCL1142015.1 nicotinate-nucleotide adenylyltransferase [Shewanella gaetbuli]